jgi:hypothetical protein
VHPREILLRAERQQRCPSLRMNTWLPAELVAQVVRVLSRLVVPLFTGALWGCGGSDLVLPPDGSAPSATRSTITAEPSSIEAGSGTSTITVTVRSDAGAAVEGASVVLRASGGVNVLTPPSSTTGPDGVATATLQSGDPGEKVISATVNDSLELSQRASVTVVPAMASRIESVAGDSQSAPVGTQVPVAPAVRVVNDRGEPEADVRVTFAVTGGGGGIGGADQTTDADGIARVGGWTLGSSPGTNTLEARAGSLEGSPVIFTAEAISLEQQVNRLIFLVPPHDVREKETFSFQVALVDANNNVVPLSGVFIYVGLFPEGSSVPDNQLWRGERFENTDAGIAEFDVWIEKKGSYRLNALTDDLPELGPHGPEPYLFSELFRVR